MQVDPMYSINRTDSEKFQPSLSTINESLEESIQESKNDFTSCLEEEIQKLEAAIPIIEDEKKQNNYLNILLFLRNLREEEKT